MALRLGCVISLAWQLAHSQQDVCLPTSAAGASAAIENYSLEPDNVNLLQLHMDVAGVNSQTDGAHDQRQGNQDQFRELVRAHRQGRRGLEQKEQKDESCVSLANHHNHFTVNVTVGMPLPGTPAQTFGLVIDTGSNTVIVPDCLCVQTQRGCNPRKNCFNSSHSSTFRLNAKRGWDGQEYVEMGELMYGSGSIEVAVGSDVATVGGVVADMVDSLTLMEDRRALHIDGDFEGILGLGLPHAAQKDGPSELFVKHAGVSRYSLCFNDEGEPGVLKLNLAEFSNPMTNIGHQHWGLDLQGVSVGSESAPALFCSPETKLPGMATTCGAIPDSGTTLMLGKKEHIAKLYESICDNWKRCQEMAARTPLVPKYHVFQQVLHDCGQWLGNNTDAIDEIPPIFFTVAGLEGIPQKIKMTPWSYIVEAEHEIVAQMITKLWGYLPVKLVMPTGIRVKACTASFGTHDYDTLKNGPVWILGTPFFYSNTVGFDVGDDPPKISIESVPCVECGDVPADAPPALLATSTARQGNHSRQLRVLKGPLIQRTLQRSETL